MGANGKDVILVKTSFNLTLPQIATSELIEVTALGHQHVVRAKFNPLCNAGGKFFQEVTTATGTGHLQKGHGVAFADINDDGAQDVFIVLGGALALGYGLR